MRRVPGASSVARVRGVSRRSAPSYAHRRAALAFALAIAAFFALTAMPALAIPHVYSTSFGSSGSGAGQISFAFADGSPAGDVAVDQSTGDVYVADVGNRRVDKFDSAGNFILAFGRDVDQTTGGDVCTAASGDTCQAGTGGTTGGGAFWQPAFVAVDNSSGSNSGDVYVGDEGDPLRNNDFTDDIVTRFTSGGAYVAGSENTGPGTAKLGTDFAVKGLSVDPTGNLWIYNDSSAIEYAESSSTPAGVFTQNVNLVGFGANNNRPIAVDGSHIYIVASGQRVRRFSLTGEAQGYVTRAPNDAQSIAVDPDTGELFVSRDGTKIERYNASCAPVLVNGLAANTGCSPSDVFGSGHLTAAFGLTINAQTSTLYVADPGTNQIAVFVPPPPGPPAITSQWVSGVGSTDATVDATANPVGNDTTCQLSYTDDATFQSQGYTGATTLPCDPADLGSRFADHPVEVELSGLAPGTTYHFRFLAHSSAGDDSGADRTFSTEVPEPNLPDGRAYEQVSPANKDLVGIRVDNGGYQAANDGNRMGFYAFSSFPDNVADGRNYQSARGAGGWSTVNQIPPQAQGGFLCILFEQIVGHSPDLSKSALVDGLNQNNPFLGCSRDDPPLVPGEPDGVQNLFIRDNVSGTYQLVSHNPVIGDPADASFAAADPSFNHVVFDEAAQLTADAPPGVNNLYEWSGGNLQLVSIDPAGNPLPGGGVVGAPVSSGDDNKDYAHHAMSDDGAKVFFQGGDGNLYARLNGNSTVQLDAFQGSGPGGGGQFQVASTDGSKVFFTDDASAGLTNDTVPGSGINLYRYDFATGNLTDLTPGADVRFAGLAGASDDGSRVYFAANGALAPGAASGADCAPPPFGGNTGTCNLYVSHNGTLSFIATLSSDQPNDCVWTFDNPCARVSADGSHLAFESDQSLTAVDTGGFTEVYLYDQPSDQLVCASCPVSGVQATGSATIGRGPTITQGGTGDSTSIPRNLSADGSRLFFNAAGPLVSRDTNGRSDVYEYEGGRPHLISTGTATTSSTFLDASSSGDDAFFTTDQKLTPSDIDNALDVYDARVGGGFPVTPPPPPCQSADQCHPGGTVTPPTTGAGSGAFNGPGNPQINRKAKKHHKKHHHKRRHHKRTAGRRSDRASQSGSSRGSAAEPFTSSNRRAGR